jgi:hypothetical protein
MPFKVGVKSVIDYVLGGAIVKIRIEFVEIETILQGIRS